MLATVERGGHPQPTTMLHSRDPLARVVRFSTTADRIKAGHPPMRWDRNRSG
nr:hypothetical protein [Streptomyces scabiei]